MQNMFDKWWCKYRFCLENSLASVTKQTFYEYVDLKWDIFVYFDLNANELNVLTLPCDTCSYFHQTVSLDTKIYYKPHRFYFGCYNATMMMVVSNLTMTVEDVNSMHINIFKRKLLNCIGVLGINCIHHEHDETRKLINFKDFDFQ